MKKFKPISIVIFAGVFAANVINISNANNLTLELVPAKKESIDKQLVLAELNIAMTQTSSTLTTRINTEKVSDNDMLIVKQKSNTKQPSTQPLLAE